MGGLFGEDKDVLGVLGNLAKDAPFEAPFWIFERLVSPTVEVLVPRLFSQSFREECLADPTAVSLVEGDSAIFYDLYLELRGIDSSKELREHVLRVHRL